MDIILVGGLWLDGSVWNQVVADLQGLGHHPAVVDLPGAGDGSVTATLDDQVAAVVGAIDGAHSPMVVGHSAACSLVWMAADRRPETIDRVVMVGGFPGSDGESYADFFDTVDDAMPFPGWGPFEGADSADLDEATKERLAANAIPVPEGVSKGVVRLTDERRFELPVILVCPEYTPEQARAWIDNDQVPELTSARNVSFIDIDSGHWPMITRPADLAGTLHTAANGG